MLISELTVYDFLREKINLSDSEARRYAKEFVSAEEKVRNDIKVKVTVTEELGKGDYSTKKDIKDVEIKIGQLEVKVTQMDAKIEKGFKEVNIWVVSVMAAIGGLIIAIIKLF